MVSYKFGILKVVVITEDIVVTCNLFFYHECVEDFGDVKAIL